jgi:hypothetical protein
MIDVKIGTSNPMSFLSENDFGTYSYKEQVIRLGINTNEFIIFEVLNHETLHAVIGKILDEKTARLFDKTFQDKHGKVIRFTLDDGTPKF